MDAALAFGQKWAGGGQGAARKLRSHRHEMVARQMGEVLGKACW